MTGVQTCALPIYKSFVLELASNRGDAILVKSTIELGHNLGLKVTAEGIEDAGAMAILDAYGCETGQGYFISKPLPAAEFETFYLTSRWSPVRNIRTDQPDEADDRFRQRADQRMHREISTNRARKVAVVDAVPHLEHQLAFGRDDVGRRATTDGAAVDRVRRSLAGCGRRASRLHRRQ